MNATPFADMPPWKKTANLVGMLFFCWPALLAMGLFKLGNDRHPLIAWPCLILAVPLVVVQILWGFAVLILLFEGLPQWVTG